MCSVLGLLIIQAFIYLLTLHIFTEHYARHIVKQWRYKPSSLPPNGKLSECFLCVQLLPKNLYKLYLKTYIIKLI